MKIKIKVKKKMKLHCKGKCAQKNDCQPIDLGYVCMECGCGRIEERSWIQINTGESMDGGNCFCPRCNDFAVYDSLSVYTKQERREFIG